MTRARCLLTVGSLFGLLTAVLVRFAPVYGEGKKDVDPELESNRQRLEQIRTDPERLAGLQRDWEAFQALPAERQENLRQLDRELRQKDSARSARLARILERYNNWLEHLPADRRQQIERAASAEERMRLIRVFREQQWLPAAVRQDLKKKNPSDRAAELRRLRQQTRERHEDWLIAFRHWDELVHDRAMVHFTNARPGLDRLIRDYLEPLLTKDEAERLRRAEGQWPEFPRMLVELMDKHPLVLPGPFFGPIRFEELPADVQQALTKAEPLLKEHLRTVEGAWPTYAILVAEVAAARGIKLPRPLGPCYVRHKDTPPHPENENLPAAFQQVVNRRMLNKQNSLLTDGERERLHKAQGHWPEFPRLVVVLARKYGINLPRVGAVVHLPGPPAMWDRYRLKPAVAPDPAVEVPAQTLADFLLLDVSPKQRAILRVGLGDPLGRERLKQVYLNRAHALDKRLRE